MARFAGFRSRLGRTWDFAWRNKYRIVIGGSLLYTSSLYATLWLAAKRRNRIHDNTYLYWRVFPGSIVEERTPRSTLDLLLGSSSQMSEEPPRILTVFELREALQWATSDPRIIGIVADFSSATWPNVPHENLGLAQIEELHDAITAVKETRREMAEKKKHPLSSSSSQSPSQSQLASIASLGGEDPLAALPDQPFRTIAVTDTFHSQSDYVLATAMDEIYMQPTGDVPLHGLAASIPFWSKLLKWAGINVHTEARTHWKSMVAPYSQEKLSPEQEANEVELLNELNDNMCTLVARSRFPAEDIESALAKVKSFTKQAPFTAKEAQRMGLITDVKYKREVLNSIIKRKGQVQLPLPIPGAAMALSVDLSSKPASTTPAGLRSDGDDDDDEEEENHMFGMYHYHRVTERKLEKSDQPMVDVAVVYLLGTINNDGSEFGTASVIRGLKEAARSDEVDAIVLRIDSGGGGVVESDTIWDAVRECKAHGKTVVASFGNAAASGGYLAAADADLILCSPSTVTGSIGVASVRPNVTQSFLDRLKLTVQSFYTGNQTHSLLHELEGEELDRHRAHIDDIYDLFKKQVCDGRMISPEAVEDVAGGRVFTGLRAYEMLLPENERGVIRQKGNYLMHPELNSDEVSPAESQTPEQQSTSEQAEATSAQPSTSGSSINAAGEQGGGGEVELPELGPLGRGLTDGLGGISDAAYLAFKVAFERAIVDIRHRNPHFSDLDVLQEILPDMDLEIGPTGNVAVPMSVRLRKFPEEKTLWEAAREAARRGESIDPTMLQAHVAQFMRTALTAALSASWRQSMDQLGWSLPFSRSSSSRMRSQTQSKIDL